MRNVCSCENVLSLAEIRNRPKWKIKFYRTLLIDVIVKEETALSLAKKLNTRPTFDTFKNFEVEKKLHQIKLTVALLKQNHLKPNVQKNAYLN